MSSPQTAPNPQQPVSTTPSTAVAAPAPVTTGGDGGGGGTGRAPASPLKRGTALVIAVIVTAIYYVGVSGKLSATNSWMWTMGLLIVLCLYLGSVISGRALGIFIGSRNLMSLSRFQMVAWSIVIISGFLTIAFRRIVLLGNADPFKIAMDPHLWALLGISTASLVGTPLILQNKTTKDPDPKAVAQTATALQASGGQVAETSASIEAHRQGNLYVNPSITDARFTDMFEGDEVGNTAYVDIAKVQMFLFTVLTIVAYCFAIYHLLVGLPSKPTDADLQMPPLSQGFIALLGISHAGYLGSKTADHTPTK
jgi:hypothetical protein